MKVFGDGVTVSILVEGMSVANLTKEEIVPFKVFSKEEQYVAIPMLEEAQRKQAGLPEVIRFAFLDHCIVSETLRNEETLEVIKSLIGEMMIQELID